MPAVELLGRVDVARSLAPFRRGHGDPTYQVHQGVHWRSTRLGSGPVVACFRQTDPEHVDLDAWGPGRDELIASFADWFPEDGFADTPLDHDVVLDARRRFPGLRTPRTGRVLEVLIAAIIEQKVVGRDAFAAWRRLLRRHGSPAPESPAPLPLFVPPTAEQWAALPSWEWHQAGVDPKRYRTAQAAARVGDRLEALVPAGPAAVYRALLSLPGVGPWTAGEVGSRALGDADAVSWGDYHLANTVGVGLTGQRVTDADVPDLLEPFAPYRGRVVRLLELSPLVAVERHGPRMSRVDHRQI